MSTLSSKLKIDAKPFFPSQTVSFKDTAMNQLLQRGLQAKDHRLVDDSLSEWFTAGTLENILTQCENIAPKEVEKEEIPLNILCYTGYNKIIAPCTLYTKNGIFYFCNRSNRLIYIYVR